MGKKSSYLYHSILIISMIFSLIYTLYPQKQNYVENYKLTEDMVYTGYMSKGMCQGYGSLDTKYGIYKGNFDKGRLIGKAEFLAKDNVIYQAEFIPKQHPKNITILSKKYGRCIFVDGVWEVYP